MSDQPQNKLALTCGDPAGIGPEVLMGWLKAHPDEARQTAVIGPGRWLDQLPAAGAKIPVGLEEFAAEPGRPTGEGALVAWAAMERAAAGCLAGEFAGVVTGPVSKARLAGIGYPYPGQTEFFAARWGGEPTMAFCGGRLRVALLSWHVPLRNVPAFLTAANFARVVRATAELAQAEGIAQPRLGVCGLNPHAGEGGLLGDEEQRIIDPILSGLRAAFPGLSACQPADTLFARQLRGEFDAVIALYHDQGLAPLKAVDFDEAVNVTLGLPHVRTSPDHGTAFDIAGEGRASPRSFANAVTVAWRLIAWRAARPGGI
ncbi:MAG TPA: 4-hydroxythreonine-4-phosphate dehydrogenase PdxA [Opitutaceae bacterium]|jgi:4-hydroxythreonine-4-phosphate dehydrogenase|nr:4-hydroxythreonine-4-phosphate dehydrogenase PdxA [Opitutaceae bacterium]